MTGTADTLAGNDSLRRAVEQMFVQGAKFVPAEQADTLQAVAPPATAADLFGPGSALATASIPLPTLPPLTAHPLFQSLILVLSLMYILLLYHHMADIRTLFVRTPSDGGMYDTRSGSGHSHFLNLTGIIGLLLTGILSVKCIDLLMPPNSLPYSAAAGVSLITTAALLIVITVQAGMLFLIGTVTQTQNFIGELNLIRRSALAVAAIATAPPLLFYTLAPAGTGMAWLYILIIEGIVIALLFLKRTLSLFISKKIPILHWILYLCIVEIFPVSLLWLLITRQ